MKHARRSLSIFLAVLLALTPMLANVSLAAELPAPQRAFAGAQNGRAILRVDAATGKSVEISPEAVIEVIVELSEKPALEVDPDNAMDYFSVDPENAAGLSSAVRFRFADAEGRVRLQQGLIRNSIDKLTGGTEVLASYSAVMNGFAIRVKAKYVNLIKALPGVVEVYDVLEYGLPDGEIVSTPNDVYVDPTVGASNVWDNLGYSGKGEVIAILDTGLDYNHELFQAMEEHEGMVTKAQLQAIVNTRTLNCSNTNARYNTVNNGQFYRSNKVPFGYNYGGTYTNDPMDRTDGHGTHVAGIAAANRSEDGTAAGIAPDAQIFAMKVFRDASAYDTDVVAAADDAVKLGATTMNLSLGSAAGFTDETQTYVNAFGRARDAGINVYISAGNAYRIGERDALNYEVNTVGRPYASNMDYGLVGSPSTTSSVTTVASMENTGIWGNYFTVDGEEGIRVTYNDTNADYGLPAFITVFDGKAMETAYCGLGFAEDFEGLDLTGKIALIRRGEFNFSVKINNAAAAGAVGVVIIDNAPSGTINMAIDGVSIPAVSIARGAGEALLEALDRGHNVLRFDEENIGLDNPSKGLMSNFTSWGVTPDLKLKPEITAPGGQIYSTYPIALGSYAILSGTSMSAPAVTGGAALVQQYVKEAFPDTLNAERKKLVDNLLMSTAKPIVLPDGHYTSPRQSGAGMMNLVAATTSTAILTNTVDGRAKVELGDKIGNTVNFFVRVTNYGDTPVSYDLSGVLLRDGYVKPEGFGYTLEDYDVILEGARLSFVQDTVTVGGQSAVSLQATLTLDADVMAALVDEVFINGLFVDGYITLTAKGDYPDLGMPLMGYYGDWTQIPVYDYNMYDGPEASLYGEDGGVIPVANTVTSFNFYAGANLWSDSGEFFPELIAINPNNSVRTSASYGYAYAFNYVGMQLRNVKRERITVVNEAGAIVRTIGDYAGDYRKTFYDNDYGYTPAYLLGTFNGRTGTQVNAAVLPQGQYYYVIKNAVDYPGSNIDTNPVVKKIPVYIDTTAPTAPVAWATVEDGRTLLHIQTRDTHYVAYAYLFNASTGVEVGEVLFQETELVKDPVAVYDITDNLAGTTLNAFVNTLAVEVGDMAFNFTQTRLSSIYSATAFTATVDPGSPLIEEIPGAININVTNSGLLERELSACLRVGDELLYETAIVGGAATMSIAKLPAAGTYDVVLCIDGAPSAWSVPVTVAPKASELYINAPVSVSVKKGKTLQLDVTSNAALLIYASSNQSIATVSQSGLVTGVKTGMTVVTVYAADNSQKFAYIVVNVTA